MQDLILNSRLLVFSTTLSLSGSRGGFTLILNYQQKWNIGDRAGEFRPGKWWDSNCCAGNCRTISDRCWRHPGFSWPDLGWSVGQKSFSSNSFWRHYAADVLIIRPGRSWCWSALDCIHMQDDYSDICLILLKNKDKRTFTCPDGVESNPSTKGNIYVQTLPIKMKISQKWPDWNYIL